MTSSRLDHMVESLSADRALVEARVIGDGSITVGDAHQDSRLVTPGSLFACIVGAQADGHDHALAAIEAGATALLCERPLAVAVPQIVVPSVRDAIGPIASAVHGFPASKLRCIGVTGTNGKTTTVGMISSILESAGEQPIVIGTLTGVRTTPEATELQRKLADAVADGATAVVMEVSSHALILGRVDGIVFDVAVFTNLSPDHLDFHGSMFDYFRAKARLFEPAHAARAAVNLDDTHGRLLFDAALIPTIGFQHADAEPTTLGPTGTTMMWRGGTVELPLLGDFNVDNALAAASAAAQLDIDDAAIVRGLESVPAVPGRFEVIDEGQPFVVVVDFAHTPDGLDRCLTAARGLAGARRVVVVFGAGGDRDATKRPLMGRAAERLADVIVVTNDNPRTENPDEIIASILAGMSHPESARVECDRRGAISIALDMAEAGDVVVVAGKGHETTQTVGAKVTPFDDRLVARDLLRSRSDRR